MHPYLTSHTHTHTHIHTHTHLFIAVYFSLARTIFGGAIGNFVSYKNCSFENNTAMEYGGAMGLILPSANAIFDNRDNIRPIMFESW